MCCRLFMPQILAEAQSHMNVATLLPGASQLHNPAAFALHRAGVNKTIWILSGSMVSQFPGKHGGSWWRQPVSSWALLMWIQCCSAKPIVELALVATLRLAGDKGWREWNSCDCTMVHFSRKGVSSLLVEAQCHKISDRLFRFFSF